MYSIKINFYSFFFFLLSFFFCSCGSKNKNAALKQYTSLSTKQTGITFENKVEGTAEFNVFSYRNFFNGGGAAIGDINNDSLPDIYFTANQQKNKLYINKGNFAFEDVTEKAMVGGTKAWSTGVSMVDINADGWLDIYVCNSGDIKGDSRENELFINNKNGTFTEVAKQYNLADSGLTTHTAFFDYDKDGDLDCYILNNSYRPIESFGYNKNLRHIREPKGGDKLMRNDTYKTTTGEWKGQFIDVSDKAGIYGSEIGFGLGVTVGDVNGDHWPDLYISNDFFEKDYLYINQHNGTFSEVLDTAMAHISLSSMGADMADVNNDGRQDIFSTDMLPEADYRLKTTTKFEDYDVFNAKLKNDFHHQYTRNMLQLNNGILPNQLTKAPLPYFSEIGQLAGVYQTDWSWGALLFDMNNDGWKDIYVCNGIQKDLTEQDFLDFFSSDQMKQQIMSGEIKSNKYLLDKMPSTKIPNYAFINKQNIQFDNLAKEYGLDEPSFSNGAAYGDLDNDGDLDIVVNNENMPAFVYKNNSEKINQYNYLKVQLVGDTANTFAIGAEVKLYANGTMQMLQQFPSRGFQSSIDYTMHFGLQKNTRIDSVVVLWPNGAKTLTLQPAINTVIKVHQNNAVLNSLPIYTSNTWFTQNFNAFVGDAMHKENVYTDFDVEKLVPQMVSLEGPKMTKGDINGDGIEDVVIGGAKGDGMKILLQQANGSFIVKQPIEITQSKNLYEDVGITLTDIDGDKDNDIIVANGGNEVSIDVTFDAYTPRVYKNDGKGNFTRSLAFNTTIAHNTSCIIANDIDNDGDNDLFIGGRSVPGKFGVIPKSYIMLNNGAGQFGMLTTTILDTAGMITDAIFANMDEDVQNELITVGQFSPVKIYKFNNGVPVLYRSIPNTNGWWNCVAVADVNNDGKKDIIAGNLGINTKLQAQYNKPIQLYVNDFDKNGQSETVLTYFKSDSIAYPLHLKGELVAQMPSLKKKFLYYKDYAGKGITAIFSKSVLAKTTTLYANEMQSCIFYNNSNSTFTKQPLPIEAQMSPIYAMRIFDANKDGTNDIFAAGNFSGVKPEIGSYDANYGQLFVQYKPQQFQYVSPSITGLYIKGEARDAILIENKNQRQLIVAMNNENPYVFNL